MSSGFFGVLNDGNSDDEDDPKPSPRRAPQEDRSASGPLHIPAYEDLSTARIDEITVLEAVYAQDFKKQDGVWGCLCLQVDVRPPDVEPERIGSKLL